MNKKPDNKNKGKKKRNRFLSFLPYILIPLIMFGAVSFASGGSNGAEKVKYYQIVQYFDEGKVDKFSLNLSSGKLKYTLVG